MESNGDMSSAFLQEVNPNISLLIKIEKLRNIARSLINDFDDIRAGSVGDLADGIDMNEEVRRFEVKLIRHALLASNGHQVRASRLLGLKPTTLNAKIKRYEIEV